MKKRVFTLFLALIMMISVVNPVLATEVSKQQVPEKVQWLINKGWVKGRGNGLDLDKTITRAEVTKMVALVADYEQEANNAKSTQGSFTDVDPAHWANGYINVAANKGYIMGYPDKTFKPENQITNAEIMTILVKLHPEWKTSLTEGKVWPTAEVTFAKNSNILKGINNLDGKNNENAIRQDVFEMIYNLCQERIRLTVKNAEKQVGVKENTKPSTINWWWNNGYVVNREYVVRFYDINKTQIYTKYVAEGDRVLNINAPKVDGFNFEGWADRNTGKYFDFNDRVYRDIDLIAKYSTDMAKIKPAEPKPVEPKPAEPKPVEPKPVEPKPVEPKPVEPKPVEPKPVEPKPGELDKQIEAEANAQLKETIEKAKKALKENNNEPAKAAEELKTAIAKAEKVLSEGNVEAKTNEITTLNDARRKYLDIATETEKLNKLLEESLPLYQDENVSNDFKKAYEEANKVSVNGESLEEVKEAISKLEKAIAKEKELNKQIEAEANAQLKETIEKAKKALKENNNEPAKAAEELKTAIAKAEKVLSEGNVEAKTNETTTLNDARIKYLNIATETKKLNKLLEESLPLYQDKNVSNEFKKAYEEANKVSVNGESLEEVKEAISKLEKAIAKEKELNKQIEAEANTQLKETIEKAKNALEENKNEPQKAAEELKKAIAKAEKVLSEGNVEAKTNEITTLNDARIKYLNITTETEKLNKLLEESLPLYQDKNVSNDFKKAYEEANKVSVNGESLEEVKEAISKLEKAIAKEKELNKQIEAEANDQLKETIEKAKKALKENNNEPAKAAEELKKAIAKAEKVLSEGNVEAKTNETIILNDARRKYLNITTETEKLNKLLEESLPLYQDKNVSDEFKNAYEEANKVSVNGESLEEVKEAISKLEKAIAKEKAVLIVFNEVTELLEKARGLLERVKVLQPTEDPLDISDKDSYVEKQEIKDKLSSAYDNLQTNFEKFKKTRDINDVLPENSKLKEELKAFEGQIKKGQLTQEKLDQAKKELQENIDKIEKIKERFKKFNADPKVKELEKLVEEAKQILTSGKYKEILAEIFNLEKTVNIDMSTISNIEELTKKANELKDSQEEPKIREVLERIEKLDEETRAYLDMKLLGELEDQYTAVTLKQEFNRLLTSNSATKEQAERALLEYDDLKQEIKSKHKDLKKDYYKVLIKFFMIKYTVNTKPEDAKVEIIERETGTVINPRENKTYYLEKDRYYKLKVSKDNYITKETDINPLDKETFERIIELQELKGTLKLSDGENYTVEQKKVKIDKSKLQEKDSKYSVILKVNSNNNDNVLYTLDNNDKATLDAELKGKVSLYSDTGKFEFNKDLEVETIYKAKASAKGYEPLEFEIVIENGTSSTDSPSPIEPQDEPQPPKEAQKVKVIFKLQNGGVSERSKFADNGKNIIEKLSTQGTTIKVPKVNFKNGPENNSLTWYEEGGKGRKFGTGSDVSIELNKDEASTLTIIGGYKY